MPKSEGKKREGAQVVVLGEQTSFNGFLRFKETLRIQGKFQGTIEAAGALIVDKGAVVEADHISVASLTVFGTVIGAVRAVDKIDMLTGAEVHGDLTAARLRIADGVLFEGQCSMTGVDKEVEIFSRPTEEIKAELQRVNG
ncbi:MAG: polymer-forming cytoskeletal protein [Treponema sp.]|jgi:cytoskeletal protein CcmA (bactofilin family)|nr:polymer-forming cytoskeletal protein [Treponema sp.]